MSLKNNILSLKDARDQMVSFVQAYKPSKSIERLEIRVHPLDMLAWLSMQKDDVMIYGSNQSDTVSIAGIGQAACLTDIRMGNFRQVFKQLRLSLSPKYPYLQWYGGFCFDQRHSDADWEEFGAYRFVIPRFELAAQSGKMIFCCNLVGRENIKSILRQLAAIEVNVPAQEGRKNSLNTTILRRSDQPDQELWQRDVEGILSDPSVEKVVLARKTTLNFKQAPDPWLMLRQLKAVTPNSYHFAFQFKKEVFLGASPERLYRRYQRNIGSEALAGTMPVSTEPKTLQNSDKNNHEHALVVDAIDASFREFCTTYSRDKAPSILTLPNGHHLNTKFQGQLKDGINDEDILESLHPTPALGGTPRKQAMEIIRKLEGFSRGWYGAPIGYVGLDWAEFVVGIRSGFLRGKRLSVFAGAGIVQGSEADSEWSEVEKQDQQFYKDHPMKFANINHCWGTLIIEELSRLGVEYFCVAPGSRSSPLVIAVAQNKKIKTFVHFDERALAFHAMGYSAATGKPAVLICTSGTAAANFFPAVIEASKKKLPLIVLTADRPPELRQTGAVQTIDQVGLFGKYTQWATDMPCPDVKISPEFVLTTIDQAWYQAVSNHGVVHINCMFRQPLTLVPDSEDIKTYTGPLKRWEKSAKPYTDYVTAIGSMAILPHQKILAGLEGIKNGLIVVGKMGGTDGPQLVLDLADKLGWPVFADLSSGLRLGQTHPNLIHHFDQLLLSDKILKTISFDGVLHLGGRITSSRYYDFIKKQAPDQYIMVLDHSLRNDPNYQVSMRIETSVSHFIQAIVGKLKARKGSSALKMLSKADQIADKTIENELSGDQGVSEPCIARLVSQLIPESHGLFLSNSMPIRDMGNFADPKAKAVFVNGNRGASGIDGIIASAAGYARGLGKPVTLMIGDLAALHDLNSLAILRDIPQPLIIVLLNNGGGGIFSFLPIADFKEGFEKFWGTPHPYTLASAASMFELDYCQPMDAGHFKKAYAQALRSQASTIIEVIISREENLKVHQAINRHILDKVSP